MIKIEEDKSVMFTESSSSLDAKKHDGPWDIESVSFKNILFLKDFKNERRSSSAASIFPSVEYSKSGPAVWLIFDKSFI